MNSDLRLAHRRSLNAVCAVLASASLLPAAESRGQVDAAEDLEAVEEIVVTGSRIKRRDFNSPSPISTIDRDDLLTSGMPSLEESLNQMPQVMPDYGRTSNNPGDGTARINLRGMGSARTLVLLNGRRIAPSGVGSAIDVNNLPQALIERVEIITGGATTVYGSDAVAGVVNFITREDFAGLSIDLGMNTTAKNDASAYDLNIAFGHEIANGRGNIVAYAGAQDRHDLFASERDLTSVSYSNNPQTGTLFLTGSTATPSGVIFFPSVDFGNGPARPTFDANGDPIPFSDPADLYNYQDVNYLQTPLTRYIGGVLATFELDDGHELYLETGYSRNESAQELAPVPAGFFVDVNTDNPLLTPAAQQLFIDNFEVFPGMANFGFQRRLIEVGSRIKEQDRDYWRTVLGFRGELRGSWDIDAWFSYTTASEEEFYLNDASASRFQQGLLVDPLTGQCFDTSNGCVPVNAFGPDRISAAAADFLRISNVRNTTSRTQQLASVVVTGSPLDSWSGAIETAIGVEWRSDDANYKADDVLFTGDTLGYPGDAPVDGRESVLEFFGEAVIPLAKDAIFADYLGLEIGVRYSEYDLAGGVWTYKVGGEWQPLEGLRFRSMFQRSVRAPNNLELFQEQFSDGIFFPGPNSSDDPCSASNGPFTDAQIEKCVIQGLPANLVGTFEASSVPGDWIRGGNPDLVPEIAETFTLGAVIAPEVFAGWQFAIDFYSMEVTDSIGTIDALSICFDQANTSNLFCDNMTRTAAAGYNIVEFYEPLSNRGLIATKGIDTQVSYQTDLPENLSLFDNYAQLSVNLIWTHMLENRWQLNPVTQIIDCAGYFGAFCTFGADTAGVTFPEDRVTTRINYASGALSVYLTSEWVSGTRNVSPIANAFFGIPQPLLAIPRIGNKNYLDLGFGWVFNERHRLFVGVNNLTNTDAPNMADQAFGNNTDALLYDVFGRSYYLRLSANFFQ
jgi:outer membrane receptor protein involved in Fe transport